MLTLWVPNEHFTALHLTKGTFIASKLIWLYNHVICWMKIENSFSEIVYGYGDKVIELGDISIVCFGYFLIYFGDH